MVSVAFDMESDVVVVGYGGAGGVASIAAHDHGAKVVMLEKMPAGGGNTAMSGGTIFTPTGMGAVRYIEQITYGTLGTDIIQTFVEAAMKNDDYIRALGGEPQVHDPLLVGYPTATGKAGFPHVPGSEFISKRIIKGTEDARQGIWKLIASNVERRGIQVLCNTPARELITNRMGEVVGVIAEREGRSIRVKSRKAVILTCGGLEYDEALKWEFFPCKPFFSYGNPGNTGDGIRMAQQAGASIWHMGATTASAGFKCDEYQAAFNIKFMSERFIYVDKNANRFMDEAGVELHEVAGRLSVFDSKRMDYPRVPMYAVFDDVARRKAPLHPGAAGANKQLYKWSSDNSVEVSKGWIIRGKSVKELAARIQVSETALQRTISAYNEYCKSGMDPEFGRAKETLVPIESPPYYAIKLWPCLMNTQGGPRRDKEARVLDPWGKPIPRLYAAGELGSIWGFLYQGGGMISECLVFGHIAGRNAATEKPWDGRANALVAAG